MFTKLQKLKIFEMDSKLKTKSLSSKGNIHSKNRKINKENHQGKTSSGKEIVCLVSHDMVRELLIPTDKSDLQTAALKKSELEKLKLHSQRVQDLKHQEKLQMKLMKESTCRKMKFQKWDESREQKLKPKLAEAHDSKRTSHLTQRALEMRLEQEDEVKRANQLILSTKCHAIRDAQVQEKRLMQKELEQNELQLDHMMEEERIQGLKKEEKQKEQKNNQKQRYVNEILSQIKDNEAERLNEAKYIEKESELMNKMRIQLKIEEQEAVQMKEKEQEEVKRGLDEVNKQLQVVQERKRLEIQDMELKVQEYLCQKAAKQRAHQKGQEKLRLAKEQEIARLRALQERQQDLQEKLEEIYAEKVQDEMERIWRQRELEAVRKKAQTDEQLRKALAEQVRERQRIQTFEIAREKSEFEKVQKIQQELAEKEKQEQLRRLQELEAHRKAILQQMKEKETERVKERQKMLQEAVVQHKERMMHEENVKNILLKKINTLRNQKVPEHYVKEVERSLKIKA